jgi:drug/metabolite transporter (DMT)-like permease
MHSHPSLPVKIASAFFLGTSALFIFGLFTAFKNIPLTLENSEIFLIHAFIALLCLFASYGLYRHKKWALYASFAFGLYVIVNFFISLRNSFPADLIFAGAPIIILILTIMLLLHRKRRHFIH